MTSTTDAAAFDALLGQRSGHVLVAIDEGLRIVRVGPQAAELAGREPDAMLGMSLIAAFGSAALDGIAREALSGTTASGEAALGHLGSRQFAVDAVPLPQGGLVLSMHDITALRRIAMRGMKSRLFSSLVDSTSSTAPTSTTAGSAASAANNDWL